MHFGLLPKFKRNKLHLQRSCSKKSPVYFWGVFALQAAVLTCSSQPVFTLGRAMPAGWWRAPWSSWWAVIPLLSSWGNVLSSRLCPCLILMESSMASELWRVLILGFVSAPSRSHLQCLCWENFLCPLFLFILLSALYEKRKCKAWPGVLTCNCQVHVVLYCPWSDDLSVPWKECWWCWRNRTFTDKWRSIHSAKTAGQNTAAKQICLGKTDCN